VRGDPTYTERGSGPGTFKLSREPDAIRVEWEFEPSGAVEVCAFTVEYGALGALWVYPDGDRLSSIAVLKDRSGVLVETSGVTVRLPGALGSPVASIEVIDRQTIVFQSEGAIPDGTPLEVTVDFPHDLTAATASEWQRGIDEAATTYRWLCFDVDLRIAPDGSLAVTEKHALAVDQSHLYYVGARFRGSTWIGSPM
jgi:hypothetical protein